MRSPVLRSVDIMRGLVAAAALALSASAASAQGGAVYREVRLDLSGLPPGATETKAQLGACLARNLPVAFAGRLNPSARGAPVLVVRPTGVWLAPPGTPTGDERNGGRSQNSSPDFMEGVAIIGNSRVPVSVSGAGESSSVVAPYQQAARRTEQLCQSFAYWLARKV